MKCCIMYSSEVCSGNMCLDKRALQATWASRARAKMLLHVQTRAEPCRHGTYIEPRVCVAIRRGCVHAQREMGPMRP